MRAGFDGFAFSFAANSCLIFAVMASTSTRIEGSKLSDREVERLLGDLEIKRLGTAMSRKSPAMPL